MKTYLGIDIGGTAVKLGLVTEEGQVLLRAETSVSFDNYRTPILDTVRAAAAKLLAESRAAGYEPAGVGVSATGQIDSSQGIVAGTCGSLPGWPGAPIRAALEADLGLPVTVANDANCMILGEAWVGAARGYTDVLGVTIGTGLGGGVITGGRLLEGARGLGGELGHMRIHAAEGEQCTCGAVGCWERHASTSALVRKAVRMNPALDSGRAIFAAARQGDPAVQQLLNDWIVEIAEGLAGLVHLFNPQLILIGGGVSSQQELLIEPLAEQVKARVMPAFAQGLELRPAALANDAGLVGAVWYHLRRGSGH